MDKTRRHRPQSTPKCLKIIPFGGCGEFGMNMTCYQLGKELIVVDAGSLFPDPKQLGISLIVPSAAEFFKGAAAPTAYFMTHGHEDHIGAMPFLIKEWPAPIYATPWTEQILLRKFERHRLNPNLIKSVFPGQVIRTPNFSVEYFPVNHSIPDACALIITTPHGKVFHSGDFKVDESPIASALTDFKLLEKRGDEGIDLMLVDSTNAPTSGMCPSESTVVKPIEDLLRSATGRVFITTFASNFWRLLIIAQICQRIGKKLLIAGRGMSDCFDIAEKLDRFKLSKHLIVREEEAKKVPDDKLVILASGSQGESRAALPRIVVGEHKTLKMKSSDLFIFSARIIPGNEKSVYSLVSLIEKGGAKVITTKDQPGIHVSGHAHEEDIRAFVKALRPKYYLPIHGTFSHMMANARAVAPFQTTLQLIENGSVINFSKGQLTLDAKAQIGRRYVEQDSSVVIEEEDLRDRLKIGEMGALSISGVFLRKARKWKSGPKVKPHGVSFPRLKSSKDSLTELEASLKELVREQVYDGVSSQQEIEERCIQLVKRFCQSLLQRKPVVISNIFII